MSFHKNSRSLRIIALIVLTMIVPSMLFGCGSPAKNSGDLKPENSVSSVEQTNNDPIYLDDRTVPAEDDPVESFLENILENMTLEEKLAQMVVPSLRYTSYTDYYNNKGLTELSDDTAEIISRYGFGGIILFWENFENPDQSKALIDSLNEANARGGHISLLIAADQEGGLIRRIPFGTYTCGNMALGAIGDPEAARETASLTASELRALGINTDYAPDADINVNPANPIIGVRSFGDDPEEAAVLTGAFIEGLHEYEIAAAVKHFPGHGDTDTDSHTGLPVSFATYDEIMNAELIPFKSGIDSGADIIMTAHIQFPNIDSTKCVSTDGSEITVPATMSHKIITDILRGNLGYDGVVCTDALNMDAISKFFDMGDAVSRAVNAGADMLLMPVDYRMSIGTYLNELDQFMEMFTELVKSGTISEDRIDEAVMRILFMKYERGLFDGSGKVFSGAEDISCIGSEEHHRQELNTAMNAVTMVKNDNGCLPLSEEEKVVCIVSFYEQINSVKYAASLLEEMDIIGSASDITAVSYTSPDTAIKDFLYGRFDDTDKFIVLSSVYSVSDLSSDISQLIYEFIEECHTYGKQTVVISTHLPYDLARFGNADALLACYMGSGMEAIPDWNSDMNLGYGPNVPAAVMTAYGADVPRGRLPVNIYALKDGEGTFTYTDEILYHRGYGISY